MGCHFLLQCMKAKRESEVAQSCPTLRDPMDCSLPGSSVHGIFFTIKKKYNLTVGIEELAGGQAGHTKDQLCQQLGGKNAENEANMEESETEQEGW